MLTNFICSESFLSLGHGGSSYGPSQHGHGGDDTATIVSAALGGKYKFFYYLRNQ